MKNDNKLTEKEYLETQKIKFLDIYKEMYYFELNKRENIRNRNSILIGLFTTFILLVFYFFISHYHTVIDDCYKTIYSILLLLMFISISVFLYFLFRFLNKSLVKGLPKIEDLIEHCEKATNMCNESDKSEEIIELKTKLNLVDNLRITHDNLRDENELFVKKYYQVLFLMKISFAILFILGIAYAIENF